MKCKCPRLFLFASRTHLCGSSCQRTQIHCEIHSYAQAIDIVARQRNGQHAATSQVAVDEAFETLKLILGFDPTLDQSIFIQLGWAAFKVDGNATEARNYFGLARQVDNIFDRNIWVVLAQSEGKLGHLSPVLRTHGLLQV